MTSSVTIPDKNLEDMTLHELRNEWISWNDFIDRRQPTGAVLGIAIEWRSKCDALIAQRTREQKQERAA